MVLRLCGLRLLVVEGLVSELKLRVHGEPCGHADQNAEKIPVDSIAENCERKSDNRMAVPRVQSIRWAMLDLGCGNGGGSLAMLDWFTG